MKLVDMSLPVKVLVLSKLDNKV